MKRLDPGKFGRLAALVLAALLSGGCGIQNIVRNSQAGGSLAIRSQAEVDTVLKGGFKTGLYSYDDKNNLTIVLLDGSIDNPTQAVTIRLFWAPRAGRTPIDASATNATVHYIVFTGDTKQAGVYSGAGFMFPDTEIGGSRIQAGVWDANLVLSDRSERFNDLLGQAKLEGSFSARRNDAETLHLVRQLNILVRERLGYPRLVMAR